MDQLPPQRRSQLTPKSAQVFQRKDTKTNNLTIAEEIAPVLSVLAMSSKLFAFEGAMTGTGVGSNLME